MLASRTISEAIGQNVRCSAGVSLILWTASLACEPGHGLRARVHGFDGGCSRYLARVLR